MSELLDQITEYEKRGGKVLLWFCPNECHGQVEFIGAGKEYIGVCKSCQTTSVDSLRSQLQSLQTEYDEFRKAALTLTTQNSIMHARVEDHRKRFEQWISASPYEREITSASKDETEHAWPGQYTDITVQLAWEAWCEAVGITEGINR